MSKRSDTEFADEAMAAAITLLRRLAADTSMPLDPIELDEMGRRLADARDEVRTMRLTLRKEGL